MFQKNQQSQPESEAIIKVTPMDELLKQLAVETYKQAIEFSIRADYGSCFRAFREMFYMIGGYEFELKEVLTELTEIMTEYIRSLEGRPVDSRQEIDFRNRKHEFKELLNLYQTQIPIAYSNLGLWFKVIKYHQDWDKQISKENFNTEMSQLEIKRKELLKLDVKKIIELMRPQAIHNCYAKLIYENAIPSR